MDNTLFGFLTFNTMWYALPLVVAVSLVYAATRHEQIDLILEHALRIGAWIVGFMGVVLLVIAVVNWLVRNGG